MTAAHIHAPTGSPFAGTAGIATVEIRSTDGDHAAGYHTLLDLQVPKVYDPAFLAANGGTTTGAEAALINALKDGMAYMDIHSSAFPDGEIRGFLAAVPDASSVREVYTRRKGLDRTTKFLSAMLVMMHESFCLMSRRHQVTGFPDTLNECEKWPSKDSTTGSI